MEASVVPVAHGGEASAGPAVRSAEDAPPGVTAGISIIVPCWREDALPAVSVARWLQYPCVREVVVASAITTGTPSDHATAARLVRCTRAGRGFQLNEGARSAVGSVLLFHHADTELTGEHLVSLDAAMRDPRVVGGAFRRRFDERHPHLRWLEPWEALRCRLFGPVFGDQSIFVRRAVFEEMGGFAEVPLMEDVEFSCRLRRQGRLAILTPAIGSSARKHLQQGRWRTTLTNAGLLALYVFGVSPQRLHRWYYRPRVQLPEAK